MPNAADRDDEDDTLDLTEDMEVDAADPDEDEGQRGDEDADGESGAEVNDEDGEEETVVSFGEDEADADQPNDSSVIKRLRSELRDAKKRAASAERAAAKPKVEVGPKPTLADHGYDEDAYEDALDAWKAKKAEADTATEQAEEGQRRAQEAWQRDLTTYEAKKVSLGVADFDDAEETVKTSLNLVQQAVIVKAARDPAALIYALGKSEAKLAELAKFDDPIKMAAAVALMEGSVKVVKRRKGPAVDRPASGSASMPGGTDKKLEELERKAEKTSDRTELIRYKKQLEERAKAKGKK